MFKNFLLMMILALTCSVTFAADYYAKPTASIQLHLENRSNFLYGNERDKIYLFAQSIQGKVSFNGKVLTQPQDAIVQYLLRTVGGAQSKICELTITTIHGNAVASIKNLGWPSCSIKGDPNGPNFNFIIN